jgi:hypothetical protein
LIPLGPPPKREEALLSAFYVFSLGVLEAVVKSVEAVFLKIGI